MTTVRLAASFLLLLALCSCANTLGGMAKDAKETGQALDSSGRRVLKASSN
jgi:predicted small secreted protein